MVELLIGKKGTGKTKALIEKVNKGQRCFYQQRHKQKYF